MKYRLKDKDLQDLLDQISAEDFSAQLKEVASFKDYPNPFARTRTIYFDLNHDTPVMLSVEITPDMVEEIEEYNPNGWNNFPEVTPPRNVLMRCVWVDLSCNTLHYAARFDGSWRDDEGRIVAVDRFRPWDEEDEA